jgi:outer membrane lipoprotein
MPKGAGRRREEMIRCRCRSPVLIALLLSLCLAACAGRPPLDMAGVDESLTIQGTLGDVEGARNRRVFWGGVIVNTANLKDATQIEVLAYPLDRGGRPQDSARPYGRFLAVRDGYLETGVYAQGRLLTVVGPVTGTRKGKVGEAPYTYPLVAAEQLHLWPKEPDYSEPRFHIGIGVIF